jgi:hypothetical protein
MPGNPGMDGYGADMNKKKPSHESSIRHSGLDLACPVLDTGESRKYLIMLYFSLCGNDKVIGFIQFSKSLKKSICMIFVLSLLLVLVCNNAYSSVEGKRISISDGRMTADLKNVPFVSVMNEIKALTGIEYRVPEANLNMYISSQLKDLPLEDAIKRLLRNFNYYIEFESSSNIKRIVILGTKSGFSSESSSRQQDVVVSSYVTEISALTGSEGMVIGPPSEDVMVDESYETADMGMEPPTDEGMVIGPPSAEGMNIGPPSAEGMNIGPPSAEGMVIGPPSAGGMGV